MVLSLWWVPVMVPVLATALASVWAVPPWCRTTLVGSGSFSMTADQYTNDIYNCTLELAASPGHLVSGAPSLPVDHQCPMPIVRCYVTLATLVTVRPGHVSLPAFPSEFICSPTLSLPRMCLSMRLC